MLLVLAILFFRKNGEVKPKDIAALEGLEKQIRLGLAKADNDATVRQLKAEAHAESVKEQVDRIAKVDDEFEKAKMLVELKKSI